jgi:hypothetical protein
MVLTREHVQKTMKKHGYAVPRGKRMAKLISVSREHPELPDASTRWLNEGQKMLVFRHAAEHGAQPVREALESGHHPSDGGFVATVRRKKLATQARVARGNY